MTQIPVRYRSLDAKTRWWKAGIAQQGTDASLIKDAMEKGVEKVRG